MKNKKSVLSTIIIGVLLLVYLISTAYIYNLEKTHFAIGTKINGIDVSLKSAEKAYEILNNEKRILKIKENGNDFELELKDIASIEYPIDDIKNSTLKNDVSLFKIIDKKDIKIDATIEINKDNLKSILYNKISRIKSIDSNYQLSDNNFIYNEAVFGNEIDFDKLVPDMVIIIKNRVEEFEINENYYIKPDSTNYTELCNENNKLLNRNLTVNLYGNNSVLIDKNEMINLLVKDNDENIILSNGLATIDNEKLNEFVKNLKEKYDTFGKATAFTTTSGDVIMVNTDCWGWQIDLEKTVDVLMKSIYDYDINEVNPIYEVTASDTDDTIGNTYVEVSLEDQHMWFYKDGVLLIESDCVTGDVAKRRNTPKGLFYILEKINGKYLRGRGYVTWVDKWMRVTWSGIGLHDAYWRDDSEFGGDTYKTDGSHGCINLPPSVAYDLYDVLSVKDPVIIY